MVGAEVDCGLVPFWVQTSVHHWEVQTSWFPVKLQHSPADFIGKNIFTTNVDDYVGYDLPWRHRNFPHLWPVKLPHWQRRDDG
jgi:hypothetical protein